MYILETKTDGLEKRRTKRGLLKTFLHPETNQKVSSWVCVEEPYVPTKEPYIGAKEFHIPGHKSERVILGGCKRATFYTSL